MLASSFAYLDACLASCTALACLAHRSQSRPCTPETPSSTMGSLSATRLELRVHLPPGSRADDLHLDLDRQDEVEGQESRKSS